jgi:hypothetical protein
MFVFTFVFLCKFVMVVVAAFRLLLDACGRGVRGA